MDSDLIAFDPAITSGVLLDGLFPITSKNLPALAVPLYPKFSEALPPPVPPKKFASNIQTPSDIVLSCSVIDVFCYSKTTF